MGLWCWSFWVFWVGALFINIKEYPWEKNGACRAYLPNVLLWWISCNIMVTCRNAWNTSKFTEGMQIYPIILYFIYFFTENTETFLVTCDNLAAFQWTVEFAKKLMYFNVMANILTSAFKKVGEIESYLLVPTRVVS